MVKVVIFDFDGTIVDTRDLIFNLFNSVASKYNLPIIEDTNREKVRNLSATEFVKKYHITPVKLLLLIKDILPKFKNNIQNIAIIEGITDVFKNLHKRGITVGIVTSNAKENVSLYLENQNISQIDFIFSEKNYFGKGNVLRHLIQQQKFNTKQLLYIGDEVRDVEAAHMAGIPSIAVTWGFNSEARLQQAKPDYLVSSPKQIVAIVDLLERHDPSIV